MKAVNTRIEGPRLILRETEIGDIDIFASFMSDPRFYQFTAGIKTVEFIRERGLRTLEENGASPRLVYAWTIVLKANNKPIGDIRIKQDINSKGEIRHGIAHLGYGLNPDEWGKGYMTEALKAVTAFVHDTLGFHRIQAEAFEENPGSWKVMEKAGYEREGTQRYGFFAHGKYWPALHQYASVRPGLIK